MQRKFTLLTTFISPLLLFSSSLFASNAFGQDTCIVNDFCESAIPIDSVIADEGFVCVEGCNLGATSEAYDNLCKTGKFPTVWYSVFTKDAVLMNIQVSSDDIEKPTITVFRKGTDCSHFVPINLTQANVECILGSNGFAEAIGTNVTSDLTYLIAVSSYDSLGGTFSLCINTLSVGSVCVIDRDITIEARSAGGSLSGPFIPGEIVNICFNVNSYSAANNSCQWFQGVVPVFGNGWDPSSFDQNNQPFNATVNGNLIGIQGNGVYGVATWDWFADVDYHYDDPSRHVGDIDGNGTIDMCSNLFDHYCPNLGGINGGCCNPCWGAPLGTILPPGWFAYGINGSCPTEGPPIRIDWGDGNSCGGGMGPWSFCFDLVVRKHPECLQDSTTSDLTVGFFTFADGEVGAWTGPPSICAVDQPAIVSLPFLCAPQIDLGVEFTEDKCADAIFNYVLDEPGVEYWTWSISPSEAVKPSPKEGGNGYIINDILINQSTEPIDITYSFAGYESASANTVVKQVRFRIIPKIRSSLPSVVYACERDDSLIITTLPLTGGLAPFQYLWSPGGETTTSISLFPPFQSSNFHVQIVDSIGCAYQKGVILVVHPCQIDTIVTDDESNEMHTEEDAPIGGGKIAPPIKDVVSSAAISTEKLRIFPLPASDFVNIEWPNEIHDATTLIVLDPRGYQLYQAELSKIEIDKQRMQINVSGYADGVYIVILRTKQSILASRLLKM